MCVLSVCVCLALTYEDDDIEVNYADTYYNEITEEDSPVRECCPVCVCKRVYVCLCVISAGTLGELLVAMLATWVRFEGASSVS